MFSRVRLSFSVENRAKQEGKRIESDHSVFMDLFGQSVSQSETIQ